MTHVISFQTPKRVSHKGLWFGPEKARRAILFIHGLGGSAFSMLHVVEKLTDKNTAVMTFNNRGHDVVSRIKLEKMTSKPALGGAAHEKFSDCIDDIQGAIQHAKRQGAKEIYLMGHSTGCQKSIYWAANEGRGVKGIILLAPVSDYAAEMKRSGKEKVLRASVYARSLVANNKKHALLPLDIWHETLDAQRFLSLYTGESVEEIFPYAQIGKRPTTLHKVKIPVLTVWAGKDEYSDRSSREIHTWFESNVRARKSRVVTIRGANHGFKKKEAIVASEIRSWLSSL